MGTPYKGMHSAVANDMRLLKKYTLRLADEWLAQPDPITRGPRADKDLAEASTVNAGHLSALLRRIKPLGEDAMIRLLDVMKVDLAVALREARRAGATTMDPKNDVNDRAYADWLEDVYGRRSRKAPPTRRRRHGLPPDAGD
jgi:hypothetical protein